MVIGSSAPAACACNCLQLYLLLLLLLLATKLLYLLDYGPMLNFTYLSSEFHTVIQCTTVVLPTIFSRIHNRELCSPPTVNTKFHTPVSGYSFAATSTEVSSARFLSYFLRSTQCCLPRSGMPSYRPIISGLSRAHSPAR